MAPPKHYSAALALVAGALLLAVAACRETVAGTTVRLNPRTFTGADEAAIAERLFAADWRAANVPLLVPGAPGYSERADAYLAPVLDQLVEQAGVTRRDSFDWRVRLVLGAEEHAYALPGGQLVIHTGFLHALDNEAEYAGVLARAVALAEQGAAMAAYDRAVEDNVLLGDLILGNDETDFAQLIHLATAVRYTPEELAAADSLAAELVCPSNYRHEALTDAVAGIPEGTAYRLAHPAPAGWDSAFAERVANCVGTDSLYAHRYREMLRRAVPN